MKGRHHLIIQSTHLKYEFDVIRNVTIIQGDSATGKTTLADMVREYSLNGTDTGISISCDIACTVLEGKDWQDRLSRIHESIVLIDEGNRFVSSYDFADAIRHSDNYYLIITRESLMALPYSVTEIYGIHSSGRFNSLEPVYHELYRIYSDEIIEKSENAFQTVMVEDSNAGYEFWTGVFSDSKCISAKGRDNIFNLINSGEITGNTLIIADGAAFGAQMARIYDSISNRSDITLFLPESFEWVILDSDVLNDAEVRNILASPEEHIEITEFFSWERYFTFLLVEKSNGTYLQYNKRSLNPSYLNSRIISKILSSLPFEEKS